jgi:hypothetical protein
MTTLREQIAADVEAVFLNVDDFAETCTYIPKDGDSRSIVAVVEEDAQQPEEMNTASLLGVIRVFVSRDSSTGIDAPQLGDKFWREADGTAPEKAYSFSGVVDESDDATATAWTLLFTRKRPYEVGGNRKR